jgi:hypothetical protein
LDIKYIFQDFIRCRGSIKQFIHNRIHYFNNYGYRTVELSLIKGLLANDGVIYEAQSCDFDVLREMDTYYYDDMRPTDIVLDIGANIGAFTLRVAKNVQHVYAVEPVFPEVLATNVVLNDLTDKVGEARQAVLEFSRSENSALLPKFTAAAKLTAQDYTPPRTIRARRSRAPRDRRCN